MPAHPEVLWAQRSSDTNEYKNVIYLTVNLPDIVEGTLKYSIQPTKFTFQASTAKTAKDYSFDLDLFAEVKPEESNQRLSTRGLIVVLRKKENKAEYWPRLTKETVQNAFIKTDFSKWIDEDEQDGPATHGVGEDMDPMGGMSGTPGMPGMGGDMDFEKMMADLGANAQSGGAPAQNEDDADNDSD